MIAQKNVTTMLVGKDLDLLANTSKRDDLATGQLGVFLAGSQTALGTGGTDLAAGDRFTIATKNSKDVIVETPLIEYSNIIKKSAVDTASATQRKRAVGFNGTAGELAVNDSTDYVLHTSWYDNSKTWGRGESVKFAAYKSSASATQAEIASGVAENFNKNFSRENPKLIKAEVLINSAGTAVPTGVDTITLKNGSKYFSATDIDDDTGTSAIAVGDYLRVGTALTDPCYKVVAIDTSNDIGTLEMPYQGDDYSAVDTNFELVVKATAATSDAGVLLSGLSFTSTFDPGVIGYDYVEFDIDLGDGFGASDTSSVATPSKGAGTYYEVAENEWFLKGNKGEPWRVGSYPKNIDLEATSGKTYDQISFSYSTGNNVTTLDRTVESFGTVLVATEDADSGSVYAQLKDVLNIS